MDHWLPADEKYCSLSTKLASEGAIEHKFRLNIKRFISFFILSFNMKRFCIMFWIDIEHDIYIKYEKNDFWSWNEPVNVPSANIQWSSVAFNLQLHNT